MTRVLAIGECMVELSLTGAEIAAVGYAGDTFNAAVYFRRLGLEVAYVTAVGRGDPFSLGILRRLAEEQVDASLVSLADGRLPGLYAIQPDAAGERRFYYWRSEAPVRQLFDLINPPLFDTAMRKAQLIYFSGVTLAVIGERGRRRLLAVLGEALAAGAVAAFDVNYRAALWPSPAEARTAVELFAPLCTYVSVSEDDETGLAGWRPPAGAELIERRGDLTVRVRSGEGDLEFRPARTTATVIDTTGAGDAFNAAYLAARVGGAQVSDAVTAARTLAEVVIGMRGAIIPGAAMPARSAA